MHRDPERDRTAGIADRIAAEVTRREPVGRLAYAVWVEAPAELRLARGLARDAAFAGSADLWARWQREEDAFFAVDGTRERADLIVDTSA